MKTGIGSLYRYYLMARHMQSRFLHELGGGDWHLTAQKNPDYLPFLIRVDAPAIYLSLWQATLYVMIEKWKKLGLSDPVIDIDTIPSMASFLTTAYFRYTRLRPDRAGIHDEWILRAIQAPIREEIQSDRRIRRWARISEFENRVLRVILLQDAKTVHNAFFDRDFTH